MNPHDHGFNLCHIIYRFDEQKFQVVILVSSKQHCGNGCYQIEEAGTGFSRRERILPEKVFLGVTGYLGWSSCGDKVPGNASPVAFA